MKISESRQLSLKDKFLTLPGFELKTAWKKHLFMPLLTELLEHTRNETILEIFE